MILAKYSNESGEQEYIVFLDDVEEANDFEQDGCTLDGTQEVADIIALPMRTRLIAER